MLLYQLCQFSSTDNARTTTLVVVLEMSLHTFQLFTIHIGEDHDSAVTDGYPDGIHLVTGQHDVSRDTTDAYRNDHFLLVGLVERHH